jgi:hypothetical protein
VEVLRDSGLFVCCLATLAALLFFDRHLPRLATLIAKLT